MFSQNAQNAQNLVVYSSAIGQLVSKLAAAAATLDNDFLRKIPREKFRTKINTPRARENV